MLRCKKRGKNADQNVEIIIEEQQQRIKKSLIEHDGYRRLLHIIGKSRKPLSSTQIEEKYGSKSMYKMLNELCPTEYVIDDCLFVWEDILENQENGEYKRKLITKFNEVFGLKWHLEDGEVKEDIDLNNNNLIRFKFKNSDNSGQVNIYHGQRNMIEICLEHKKKNRQQNACMTIYEDNVEYTFKTEKPRIVTRHYKKTSKTAIYTLKYNPNTTRYLDVTLKPKAEKLMSDKRKEEGITDSEFKRTQQRGDYGHTSSYSVISDIALADSFHDIREMRDNRGNWRYSLNLRGLLLYLYHENNSEDKTRKAKSRIREVISNPILKDKAKFLMFWEDFKKIGFNIFDLLLEIGREYKDQLHISVDVERQDNNYYMRRITERFYVELQGIFRRFYFSNRTDPEYFINKLGAEKYNKILERINDYKAIVFFSFQKDLIRKQLEDIEYYDEQNKTFRLEKDLHNAIDASKHGDNNIILIDKLAQKHDMSSEDVRDFINSVVLWTSRKNEKRTGQRSSTHYFNYKDKQYLVVNSCLISMPKLDKLKSLLFDGMDKEYAYLTLEKYNIPKSCSYEELLCNLGFKMSSNSDYSAWHIVKESS